MYHKCDRHQWRRNTEIRLYKGSRKLESLKTHITKKCQAAMENLVKIHKIRKYLMEEATKLLLVGLVLSHLDYANTILAGSSKQ